MSPPYKGNANSALPAEAHVGCAQAHRSFDPRHKFIGRNKGGGLEPTLQGQRKLSAPRRSARRVRSSASPLMAAVAPRASPRATCNCSATGSRAMSADPTDTAFDWMSPRPSDGPTLNARIHFVGCNVVHRGGTVFSRCNSIAPYECSDLRRARSAAHCTAAGISVGAISLHPTSAPIVVGCEAQPIAPQREYQTVQFHCTLRSVIALRSFADTSK